MIGPESIFLMSFAGAYFGVCTIGWSLMAAAFLKKYLEKRKVAKQSKDVV